eukprot:scaffold230408_cov32-Tisochrysis_lutea.AAC.1
MDRLDLAQVVDECSWSAVYQLGRDRTMIASKLTVAKLRVKKHGHSKGLSFTFHGTPAEHIVIAHHKQTSWKGRLESNSMGSRWGTKGFQEQ